MTPDFEKNNGLLPAIVQDNTTGQVLMLAYMNREAWEKTQEIKLVTFYSRSRQSLWTKGETSGNYLHLISMQLDCDADTILVQAKPVGPACHTGSFSCFGEEESRGFLARLESIIVSRGENGDEGSYTSKLLEAGVPKISQKVGEEAVETIIEAMAGNRDLLIEETSDLMYHLLVLLKSMNVTLADIEKKLMSRHRKDQS